MNQFGKHLRLSIFGESHGPAIGMVIDGMPSGIMVNLAAVQQRLDARRPGTGPLVSSRKETDEPEILSGVYQNKTTGAPLAFIIRNRDTRSGDYADLASKPRPGHSDYVAHVWSNGNNDHRGGGHYSGRLTACLVAAAALVEPMLAEQNIAVAAHLQSVAGVTTSSSEWAPQQTAKETNLAVAKSSVHAARQDAEEDFAAAIDAARHAKDSLGGVVAWQADGVPVAWGDPFFDSVESHIAHLLFSVPAVKGVDFGSGWAAAQMRGSQHNDEFKMHGTAVRTTSNHAGGILGGRTTGEQLFGRVAIKPTSSIFQPQKTVDLVTGQDAELELKGRHDPCIAIRAVPVVRACIELALADFLLHARQEGHA